MANKELPSYAPYFLPSRYTNPKIKEEIANLNIDGQL